MSDFRYLIDVNVPKYVSFFNQENFAFVDEINSKLSDRDIWTYALENNYVIVTRDFDFYIRAISTKIHPKIVFFRTGNQSLKQFYNYLVNYWATIEMLLKENSVVIGYKDIIEAIV